VLLFATVACAALLALLAVLDVLRASAGAGLRPFQWLVGVLWLLALWRELGARRVAPIWPTLGLAALLLPLWVDHSRSVASDGLHYYSYLRSALFDADLDLANDQALLEIPERGPNVFPVGPALLWAPFVVVVHGAMQIARLFGAEAPNGTEPPYQAAVCLATLAYGSAALFLLERTLRRWAGVAAAFWATLLSWVASPLRFYLGVLPSLAHGLEFFATVIVIRAALALRAEATDRRALQAGAACGLAFLVRYQAGLLLLLPACALWPGRASAASGGWARVARAAGLVLAAFLVAALPQLGVWQSQFGAPVLIPQQAAFGGRFMSLSQPHLADTLLSPRGGLLVWYPLALAGLIGLLALLRRDARYVVGALAVALGTWLVNSTVFDWYQVRRFTLLFPLLAPGLAALLEPLARAAPVAPALLALLGWRYDLGLRNVAPLHSGSAAPRLVVQEMADGVVEAAFARLEPWSPRAAVRLLGAYTGEPLLDENASYVELGREPALLRLPRRLAFLSEVEVEDGLACRWVRGKQASFVLPLSVDSDVVVTLHARALESEGEQAIEAVWNGSPLGRRTMALAWADYRFDVGQPLVRRGANALELRFEHAPLYRRVRGQGPREFRSAALAWLRLNRR